MHFQQSQSKENAIDDENQKPDESTEDNKSTMPALRPEPDGIKSTCQALPGRGVIVNPDKLDEYARRWGTLLENVFHSPDYNGYADWRVRSGPHSSGIISNLLSPASVAWNPPGGDREIIAKDLGVDDNYAKELEAFAFKRIHVLSSVEIHIQWLQEHEKASASVEETSTCAMSLPNDSRDPKADEESFKIVTALPDGLHFSQYNTKVHENTFLPAIRQLISKDLSEPYSIYVYRYFLYQWSDLCFMALDGNEALVGVIICKLEPHRSGPLRGYIAMLAVREEHRGQGIATRLVRLAIDKMIERDADEIALETEVTNIPSLKLYERLGFLRSKQLHRYYLNGNAAFRLVLQLKSGLEVKDTRPEPASQAPVVPPKVTVAPEQSLNGATTSS